MRNIGEREREEVTKENGDMGVSLLGISVRSQDSQCVEGMKGICICIALFSVAIIVIIVVYGGININSSNLKEKEREKEKLFFFF